MSSTGFFRIDKFSNHFVVTQYTPLSEQVLRKFCKMYIQFQMIRVGFGFQRTPSKVFASHCAVEREYRFHRNQWDAFAKFCGNNGIDLSKVTINTHTPKRGVDVGFVEQSGKTPRDYQVPIFEYLNDLEKTPIKLVGIQTGKGKGQPSSSKIKVLGGWTTMGDVKVGDMITGRMGGPIKVTGKFPQGIMPVYKFVFEDGRHTKADINHLWKIYDSDGSNPRLMTTKEIRDALPKSEDGLFIDLCVSETLFTTNRKKFRFEATENKFWAHGYYGTFSELDNCLKGDHADRHAFLNGIVTKNGTFHGGLIKLSFDTASVVEKVATLARSLGGIAYITNNRMAPESDDVLANFTLRIKIDNPFPLFKFSGNDDDRNTARKYNVRNLNKPRLLRLDYLVREHDEETFCISVDSDDKLYVTDDYIVTHNTYTAMKSIADEGKRVVAILKKKYAEKWHKDILEITNATKDEVLVIRGSTALMQVIEAGAAGTLTAKAIIISNRTLQNYISLYEEKGDKILDMGYDCCPQDLFEVLGADTRLIDEVHEDFHLNFKIDLYTHVHRSISLSATLISEEHFLESMYELAYPTDERYDKMEYDRYILSHAYHYSIKDADKWNVTGASGMYSHHLVEQKILANNKIRLDFFGMVKSIYDEYFVNRFKPGQRALIFCASIDMCTALTMWLQKQYPGVDICRYVEDDPYEDLLDARTSVSTIQSAGTGVDISGLVLVILTTAISSGKSNIQGFGRLRPIAETDVHFVYLVCDNIAKNVAYHEQKRTLLIPRTASYEEINSEKVLGK